jgi:hypothetical protein
MSLTNPNTPVSQQDLQDFYHKLVPYMGGSFEAIANKFSKGDMYSTDEKMIGQWIDGKPLYQKAVQLEDITLGTTYSFNIESWNMDKLLNAWGFGQLYHDSVDQGRFIFPSAGTGTYNQNVFIKGNTAGTTIAIYSAKSSSGSPLMISGIAMYIISESISFKCTSERFISKSL